MSARTRRRLALAAVVAAAATAMAAWPGRDGSGPAGRAESSPAPLARPPSGELIDIRAPVRRYRIVYRLDDHARPQPAVTTEEVVVDRPYRSRRTLWSGTDTSAPPARISVSDFGVLSVRSRGARDLTVAVAPAPATGDLRLDHALDALVAQGLVRTGGLERRLGRRCQVLRTGEPIGTGRLVAPTDQEWVDLCVDDRGLVLEERWFVAGRLLQHRVAVEASEDPDLAPDAFSPFSDPVPVEEGGGAVLPVDPASRPDFTLWELESPPQGFAHRGRFEVLSPSGERSVVDPDRVGPPRSEVVDVYERGADFLVIARGSVVGREPEFASRPHGVVHDLGALGRAELEVGVYGHWLRIRTDAVQFLSMRATLSPDALVRIARGLSPSARGQLRYLPEPPGG